MSIEYFDIPDCPKCRRPHRYKLNVERSWVMKLMTMQDRYEQPRSISFTRFFTCPDKNEDYQATFLLSETSSSPIENVTVVGIANGEE